MRFEKWLQLAILYGFDPDSENKVVNVCEMLPKINLTFRPATIALFPSH